MSGLLKAAFCICLGVVLLSAVLLPSEARAAPESCNIKTNPANPSRAMDSLEIIISSNNLARDKYYVYLSLDKPSYNHQLGPIDYINGGITGVFPKPDTLTKGIDGWAEGSYKVVVVKESALGPAGAFGPGTLFFNKDNISCEGVIKVVEAANQNCTLTVKNQQIDPDTDVLLRVDNIQPGTYAIHINDKQIFENEIGPTKNQFNLGRFDKGSYLVGVKNICGPANVNCAGAPPHNQCTPIAFGVVARGEQGGGVLDLNQPQNVNQVKQTKQCVDHPEKCSSAAGISCDPQNPDIDPVTKVPRNQGSGIWTSIGCVPTEPKALIAGLLRIAAGAGGGIAFLLMIFGAFQMITSAGNPEGVKKGSEQLTSAVIGLLFVVFSVMLLQVIGVDILQIPGFGK